IYLADYHGPTPFISEMLNRNLFVINKLMENRYDVVICHNLPSCYSVSHDRSGHYSRSVAYIHDPIQFTITGNVFQLLFKSSYFRRSFAKKWLKCSDIILVNSKRSQKMLKTQTDLESTVLYPTIVTFNKTLPESRERFFLCVGRIGFHPAFDQLLKIIKSIPEMHLVIAGSWSHSSRYIVEMFSAEEQVKERVKILTNPTDDTLTDLYRRARAFIYPGIENFNMSALEAISNGCPVILSKESGVCEILGDYTLTAESGSFDLFVNIVHSLLNDEKKAIEEGRRLYEIAKGHDTSNHMKQLTALLDSSIP
ncbi:MAG: glycosyltransferase family 4 protein, partial [Nitrososphaerales archaeon]